MCAKVKIGNKTDTIEKWYQLSKDFNGRRPLSTNQAKQWQHQGLKATSFWVNDIQYDIKYLTAFYELMWVVYLDRNPNLVEYAKQFDDYSDVFKKPNTINCQADTIRKYIKNGRESLMEKHKEFLELLKNNKGGSKYDIMSERR